MLDYFEALLYKIQIPTSYTSYKFLLYKLQNPSLQKDLKTQFSIYLSI